MEQVQGVVQLRFLSIEIFYRISLVCVFYMLFIAHLHHIGARISRKVLRERVR